MKDKMKGLIVGLTIGTLLSGSVVMAAGTKIEVNFRNLKYMFDGVEKAPKEGKGFIYEGNTYVPLRFISESLGKPVEWDEANNTIWMGKNPNHIVATYRGGKVTQKQFDTYLNIEKLLFAGSYEDTPEYNREALNNLLRDEILYSRASATIKSNAKKLALEHIKDWKSYSDQFAKDIKAANVTEADLELFLTRYQSGLDFLTSTITESQLKAKYQDNLAIDKDTYTSVTLRHILIGLEDDNYEPLRTEAEALKRAQEVQTKLKNKGDFAALAKEYSDDPGSSDLGGLIEDAPLTSFVEEFKVASSKLPIGTISDPVLTDFGYHIIKVESRDIQTLEQVKEDLKTELLDELLSNFVQTELPKLLEKSDF
ncbi:peptidylprolyl isomerase [Paenibacillus eucommiae]|uniref:Foldase protein PrsA n=1 Tax=Paenibacillus eucommiae TaxID=1355755 RepID=A0ABS4J4T1_9BACL|nr:peptidylprolyl isomerase [Paenibacillus eucommiae]MBP1994813.1 foldase protein PrsA [Paenibacillus eucommiae]